MVRLQAKLREGFEYGRVHGFVDEVFGESMHAKRVESLSNATLGVMAGASLAVHAIGQALAFARGLHAKHAVKQVDRLLGSAKLDVWALFADWVPYLVGARPEIVVALDWTDFAADQQATVMLTLVTSHGRSVPLVWQTVAQQDLKGWRNLHEDQVLERLAQTVPAGVKVTVLADRGFFDRKLLAALHDDWGFHYIVRMRENIHVTDAHGERRTAKGWVGPNGRLRTLHGATVTAAQYPVPTVVCVQDAGMQGAWCLVASEPGAAGRDIVRWYAKRWGVETTFRDTKDLRFGMGLDWLHTRRPERRDRLFLLSALAIVLLTLLGAAGESLGYDRMLKANTEKRRTHSLFNQGAMLYNWMPTMPERYCGPLIQRFNQLILEHRVFNQILGIV